MLKQILKILTNNILLNHNFFWGKRIIKSKNLMINLEIFFLLYKDGNLNRKL